MRMRLKIFIAGALILCAATVAGQNGDRIEFQADGTATEFIEGGVSKLYSGNVIARSADLELKADEATYNSVLKMTRLYGGSSLRDSVRILHADTLVYYDRRRVAVASGNVRGFERSRSILAGKVTYDRNRRLLTGTDGVTVYDDSIRSSMTGMRMVLNDSTRDGLVAGMPSLVRKDDKGSIITITGSDSIRVFHQERKAEIWSGVVVKKDSMTARAERALYDDGLERITLTGNPVIEHIMHGTGDEDKIPIRILSEVTGDTIFVFLKERVLTSMHVTGNAAGTTTATDSSGAVYYRSVLESRLVRMDMDGDQVSLVTAEGNASSYYMHAATKKGRKMFVNSTRGDTIRFFFEDGGISEMRIRGMSGADAVGKYFEYSPVTAEADSVKDGDEQAEETRKREKGGRSKLTR